MTTATTTMIEKEDRGWRLGLRHCGWRGQSPTTDDSDRGDDADDADDTADDDERGPRTKDTNADEHAMRTITPMPR